MHAKLWIAALAAGLGLAACDAQNNARRGGFGIDIGSGYQGGAGRGRYDRIGYRPERQDEDYEGIGDERVGITSNYRR